MRRIKYLKITLSLGAVYYLFGSVAHFSGLTIFPFFAAGLYTPYHDSVIALAAFIFALFLFAIATDPVKNIDTLKVVIVGALLASVFSVLIPFLIDFSALGGPEKSIQTTVEGIVGFVFTGFLLWFYPAKNEKIN